MNAGGILEDVGLKRDDRGDEGVREKVMIGGVCERERVQTFSLCQELKLMVDADSSFLHNLQELMND